MSFVAPSNEALRSSNIRMLKDLQDAEKEKAILSQRVAQLEAQLETRVQRPTVDDILGGGRSNQPLTEERDEQRALVAALQKELAALEGVEHAAREEAVRLQADAESRLNAARAEAVRLQADADSRLDAARAECAAMHSDLSALKLRTDELKAERSAGATAAEAEATRRLEEARAAAAAAGEREVVAFARAEAELRARIETEAEAARAALDVAGAAAAAAELEALRGESVALRASAAAREEEGRDRAARERAACARAQAAELAASEAAARAAEAVRHAKTTEERSVYLVRELAGVRRQLAEVEAGARNSHGTGFQQFVALKREIASLRASIAAQSRSSSLVTDAATPGILTPVSRPRSGSGLKPSRDAAAAVVNCGASVGGGGVRTSLLVCAGSGGAVATGARGVVVGVPRRTRTVPALISPRAPMEP